MEIKIYNKEGKSVGAVNAPEKITSGKTSKHVLYEAVRAHLLNKRSGTASTKTRGEVSGGGKKPWKQKHTGNARSGSTRSPLWRGGGIIFGPKPKDWSVSLPRAKKRLALALALGDKMKTGGVAIVEDFDLAEAKTKSFAAVLKKLGCAKGADIIYADSKINKKLKLSSRNIAGLEYKLASDINAYETLRASRVLITKSGYDALLARLGING